MSNYYAYSSLAGAAILMTILGVLLGIAVYVLTALGLYTIAKNRGMENPWLAWIPIAQLYIIGDIVKELKFGTAFTIPKMELVLPLGNLAMLILGGIPVLGWLVRIAFAVVAVYSLYIMFKKYVPEQAVLYTVLSCIGLFAIFIFIIRKKTPVEM